MSTSSGHAMIVPFIARVRSIVRSPYYLIDINMAGTISAFGLWILQPGWMSERFPHIAADMEILFPIWVWGIVFCSIGAAISLSAVLGHRRLMAFSYILSVVAWVTVGWLFCVRPNNAPPVVGVIAPIHAVCAFFRTLQIPDGD